MNITRRWKTAVCQSIVACVFAIAGCALLLLIPRIHSYTMSLIRNVKPDGVVYDIWQNNPPVYHNFYVFNWTNPEELYDPRSKPRFEEIGPFAFVFTNQKTNITWNDNDTVTFRNLRYWHFDPTRSAANLSQKIVTINTMAIAVAYRIRFWMNALQGVANFAFRYYSQKMYVEKSVGEILFDGYEDPVLDMASVISLPEIFRIPEYDRIGWLYKRNASQILEKFVNVGMGEENIGQVLRWNFLSEVPYYSESCGAVTGSFGEFYAVPLSKKAIDIFWPEACRFLSFDFERETEVHGIESYEYSGRNTFANGRDYSDGKCVDNSNGDDVPSGIFNLSGCKSDGPFFVSFPHFFGADPYYLDNVDGLRPNKEKHDVSIIVDQETGIVLNVTGRLQVNVLLLPNKYISMFEEAPKVYLPVFWVEQESELPPHYFLLLKVFVNQGLILRTTSIVFIFVGILTFLLAVCRHKLTCKIYVKHMKKSAELPALYNEETNKFLSTQLS